MFDDKSPTSPNLWNDHVFIIKEYSLHLHWYETNGAYTQNGQYHTMESRVHLTCYQSHALNLVVPIYW